MALISTWFGSVIVLVGFTEFTSGAAIGLKCINVLILTTQGLDSITGLGLVNAATFKLTVNTADQNAQ